MADSGVSPTGVRQQKQAQRSGQRNRAGNHRAKEASRPLPNGNDHHHVGTGPHLPNAIEMDELREGQPLVHIHRQNRHFREGRHARADCQQRQIREDGS